MPNDKIKGLDELAGILDSLKARGKRICHCHGVFDLVHIGHIRHFEEARGFGDVLVVTITPDRYVNKGPHRPAFTESLRAEAVAALSCIDFVAVNRWPTAVETLKLLKPDFYVKGPDYRDAAKDLSGGIVLEEEAVRSVGGKLVFTDDITFSSSSLINRHLAAFPDELSKYLGEFSARYREEEVIGYLEGARSLKVLVIGEAIIDEYHYCETLGKAGKEPILVAKFLSSERFAGGILAVANHAAALSDSVGLVTALGEVNSQESFIRERLAPAVEPMFVYMDNAPTIVKCRYVEIYPFQKLFEICYMKGPEEYPALPKALCAQLEEVLPDYDVVIVTDYGHGLIGPEAVELLCEKARFLAVNTQLNADNRGFNTVSKYPRPDFVCISETELRLEARNRTGDIEQIVLNVAAKLDCSRILVTQGAEGCLTYSAEGGFLKVPAFTSRIVDRIGAGDAVLAVAALCVAQGAPMDLVGFIGNAVGAQAVSMVGNRKSISRVDLIKHVVSLLK